MLGDAYSHLAELKAIPLPILVITSEFGTVSMWDWEINNYLASEGVNVHRTQQLGASPQILQGMRPQARAETNQVVGLSG